LFSHGYTFVFAVKAVEKAVEIFNKRL
jgi:hypothetical protein